MLITVSVVFVLTTLPNCIMFIAQNYWDYEKDILTFANHYLIYQIVFVLSDSNHAVNFYLYFLSGRKFRQHFCNLICCRIQSEKKRRMTTMSYMTSSSHMSSIRKPPVYISMETNSLATSETNLKKVNGSLQGLDNVVFTDEDNNTPDNRQINMKTNEDQFAENSKDKTHLCHL